jgi:hypothetical protein
MPQQPSVADFILELEEAPGGAALLYAEEVPSLKSNRCAKLALAAYYRGEVELVQQRVTGPHSDGTPGKFNYYAIKRAEIKPPRVPIYLKEMVARLTDQPLPFEDVPAESET